MLTRIGGNAPKLRTTGCSKQVPNKDTNQTSTTLPLYNPRCVVGWTHTLLHIPTRSDNGVIHHTTRRSRPSPGRHPQQLGLITEHCRKLQYKDTKFVEHPSCISSPATALYSSECMISVPTASGKHQEISPLEISASPLERKGSR